MPRAFVVMTAMPPTIGHLNLIRFSASLADTTVLLCVEPGEPYIRQRREALFSSLPPGAHGYLYNLPGEQNPDSPGFWKSWRALLERYGFRPGDYVVASEPYGAKLAEVAGGVFMPYDLERTIYPCKATDVRNHPTYLWRHILPEFRRALGPARVTLFGAESCGKTTLSKGLSGLFDAPWLFEWARPYLDMAGTEITTEKMTAIWQGQLALQRSADYFLDSPVIFQDTDLFSTAGYWDMWDGKTPEDLVRDATAHKSDLYLIVPSNIPFEPDPQRYGGDKRESSDQYWIDLCERHGLNYVVLTEGDRRIRIAEAAAHVDDVLEEKINLKYDRRYND